MSNKSKQKPYGAQTTTSANVTGQIDKSTNGTTKGNLAFVLNRPPSLWIIPLTRVLTRNATNKNLQWQFGKGQTSASVASSALSMPVAAASPKPLAAASPPKAASPAPAAPATPAKPPAEG